MNLRQLEVFLAVADSGSFSRAAEAVLLTQSTVSQHVAALEEELGTPLFDRTGRGAELTEGGVLLQRHARRVTAECQALRHALAEFCGSENQQLVVGASNIPGTYLLPGLLGRFALRHPGVTLQLVSGDSREIVAQLVQRRLALAVVGDRLADESLTFVPLLHDALQLVVGPGHPWRGRRRVTLAELSAEPLLVREEGSGSGRATREALQQAGHDLQRQRLRASLGSNEAVKQGVIDGAGVAFLSSLSIRRELEHGELAALTVEGVEIRRALWLVTRRDRALSPAAQAFIRLLEESCRTLAGAPGAPPAPPPPDRWSSAPGR